MTHMKGIVRMTRCLSTVLVGIVLTMFASIVSAQQITVGPNVQVSKANSNRAHTEMSIAANPDDPKHLLACSIITNSEGPPKSSTIAYVSFDGGATWMATREVNEYLKSGDPGCTLGPARSAYFITDVRTTPYDIFTTLYRSKDGGRTWLPAIEMRHIERPSIRVDDRSQKYKGNIYINGSISIGDVDGDSRSYGIGLRRSVNGGESFEQVSRLALQNDRHYINGMGNCGILSDGTVACVFSQSNDDAPVEDQVQSLRLRSKLKVITSSNGGASLSKAVTVADHYMMRRPPGTTSIVPTLAVDEGNGPFKDRIYVTWTDVSSGRSEISFAYSSDKGKTWSQPILINDDRPFDFANPSLGPDDFMPTVAVNRSGVVGVMWYDRRENPDNLGWHVRFSASLDGGDTFLPSVKISESPTRFDAGTKWPVFFWRAVSGGGSNALPGPVLNLDLEVMGQLFNGGDYNGMAADAAGVFHPLWADNRTGLHQLWTAGVSVRGVVKPNPELTDLEDITEKVTLEILRAEYDRKTDSLTVDVRLTNTSKNNLLTPFKARIVGLKSDIAGQLAIIAEQNDRKGIGALLSFAEANNSSTLQSGESTGVERLIFQLSNTRPLARGRDVKLGLINLEMLVFGRIQTSR
jgi:hypothetical protein